MICSGLIETIDDMYRELKSQRLEVIIGPGSYDVEYRGVRQVVSENPEWYRKLCSMYSTERSGRRSFFKRKKHDTKIKRMYILSLLDKMRKGIDFESKYKQDLIDIAEKQKEYWLQEISLINN